MAWPVTRLTGSAAELHARTVPEPAGRAVWVLAAERPALVLGSTQPDSVADAAACEAAGIDIARRRSGGGAVLVTPDATCWVDVLVPRGDALWDDDVTRSSAWLAAAWASALGDLGVRAEPHRGPMARTPWDRLVCFAGRAPGEVVADGRKVVGVAQRRTRSAARFQCAVLRRWDPVPLLGLLALAQRERERAATELAGVATGLDRDAGDVVDALLRNLP